MSNYFAFGLFLAAALAGAAFFVDGVSAFALGAEAFFGALAAFALSGAGFSVGWPATSPPGLCSPLVTLPFAGAAGFAGVSADGAFGAASALGAAFFCSL